MISRFFLVLGLCLIAACAHAPEATVRSPSQGVELTPNIEKSIINSRLFIIKDPFPCVCALYPEGRQTPIGSGVLIGRNVVLTVGHCLDGIKINTVVFGEQVCKVKSQETFPKFKLVDNCPYGDVGVIELETGPQGIAPAKLPDFKLTEEFEEHQISLEGFTLGVKSVSIGGVAIYNIEENKDTFCWLAKRHFMYYGDSGGGVFMVKNNEEYLIGLASYFRIDPLDNQPLDSNAVRVDTYVDWIKSKLLQYNKE